MKLRLILIAALIAAAVMLTSCTAQTDGTTAAAPETSEAQTTETGGTTEPTQPEAGVKAADFSIWDNEENEVKISDFYGKPTVIKFWATWQKDWKTELEFINEIYPEYEHKVNFVIIHLSDNDKENMFRAKGYIIENGYTFPAYFDNEHSAAKAYGVKKQPVAVFIDSEGNVSDTFEGEITKPVFKGYIERLLSEEPAD